MGLVAPPIEPVSSIPPNAKIFVTGHRGMVGTDLPTGIRQAYEAAPFHPRHAPS